MKRNLEIEYKTLINKEHFDVFRNALDFSTAVKQVNQYYDTASLSLYKQHVMCRIRIIDTYYEFTLKDPKKDGVLEYELVLDSIDLNDHRVEELLSNYGVDAKAMTPIAISTTYRHMFDDLYGTWCLDETHFNHSVDYEIEYELFKDNEKAYQHYIDTLASYNIPYAKSQPKFIRALIDNQRITP